MADLVGFQVLGIPAKHCAAVVGIAILFSFLKYSRALYRLHFHPLKDFPGPRSACVSDKWLYRESKKRFPEEVFEQLHRKYGETFSKHAPFYNGFNTPHTLFAETDPHLHKERRRLLNPMFSRQGVFKLEPVMQAKLSLLLEKIDRLCPNAAQSISEMQYRPLLQAMDILIAGADTTASTLTTGLAHILSNPAVYLKFQDAVKTIPKGPDGSFSLQELEKCTYLTSVVKECIRIGMAVPGRLPRVVPNGTTFLVDNKLVPPGTVVSMSTYTMHTSVEAWGPDAREFNPERWCGPDAGGLEQ
ncbi:cytochrome P450 [Mariannaea sp. PMI_226]|nr:cytochrome P450 [Mariannaea sp. PMI_226]